MLMTVRCVLEGCTVQWVGVCLHLGTVVLVTIVLVVKKVQLLMHLLVQLATFVLLDRFNLSPAHLELTRTKVPSLNALHVPKALFVTVV